MKQKIKKFTILLLILILIFLIISCSSNSSDSENVENNSSGSDTPEVSEPTTKPVLYIGIMVHLEGYNLSSDSVYNEYKRNIISLGNIFNEYGAKLTLEAKELISACDQRNDYFLKILENNGHGIGVHADAGGVPDEDDTWEDMSNVMKSMKETLEKQNVSVRHVSGYCSPLDWVSAVTEAGYSFVSGGVSWCLMTLPESEIPSEYLSCSNPAECHDPYPENLKDRMHPWTIKNRESWTTHNSEGELVFLPSAIEGLPYMSEKYSDSQFKGKPTFDEEDIELYIEQIEKALTYLDPDQPNFAYAGWSYGTKMPESFARKWLSAIAPYVEEGKVEWKTLPEMYDLYIDWRNN